MGAPDSSRTPAWGLPSSARSKFPWPANRRIRDINPNFNSSSMGISSGQWLADPRLESRRVAHLKPIRWKPHCIWGQPHTGLERGGPHALRLEFRVKRVRCLCRGLAHAGLGRGQPQRQPHTCLERKRVQLLHQQYQQHQQQRRDKQRFRRPHPRRRLRFGAHSWCVRQRPDAWRVGGNGSHPTVA